jgi:nucleotide-binding universal stress UspA family protein
VRRESWYESSLHLTSRFSFTAFILAKEGDVGAGGGVLDPSVDGKHVIQTPALEYLASRGCQWLITRQLHDIAFLTTNVMDLDELAYGLFLNEDRSANMFVYVNGASKSFRGKNLVVETKSSSGAMEIKASSLCSPAMIQACSDLKASCGGKLSVSSHRYLSLIQHLQAKLSSPGAFKPALLFLDGFIYLRFDIADLSLSEGTVCVAFANKMPATSFISLSDAENMIPMVHSQDSADKFRGLLSHAASDHKSKDLAFSPIVKAARKPGSELDKPADIRDHHAIVKPTSRGKSVVLLLSDNPSTRMALNLVLSMLRPGYDHLHLVIVKSQSTTEPALKTLCEKYELQARASLATVTSTILHGNLMSAIEDHVERVEPDLVVVGSQSNLQVSATLPIGSISINLLRNLRCPVLYVNHQAALSRIHWDQADPDPLKVMVTVDHQSRPLLKFVCEKILNPARQDKVYLARGRATNIATNEVRSLVLSFCSPTSLSALCFQELMTTRRLLDDFSVIAARSKVEVLKRPLDGNLVVEGPKRASSDECHIFAIQIPKGKAGSLPESITHLLKRSKSALLVFKSNNEV